MPTASPASRPPESFGAGPRWRWLRRYFGFSRGETQGFIVLLAIIAGAAALPRVLRPVAPVYDPAADRQELDQLVATLRANRAPSSFESRYPRAGAAGGGHAGRSRFAAVPQVRLSAFDPNQLAARDWEARGVPHFVAARIEKYGQAAGGFKAKSQIQRIYGLPDSVYQRLAPFMQLPTDIPRREYANGKGADFARTGPDGRPAFAASKFPKKPRNLAPFDLNKADTTQLMQIRGIGAGRAKWIVRRREELGGFVNEAQLADVFVLRDAPDLQDSLRRYTFVAPDFQPVQLNLNTATFEEMAVHPHIGKRLGRVIVAYRKQHPPFQQPKDLRQIRLVSEEDLTKMRPYIRFQ